MGNPKRQENQVSNHGRLPRISFVVLGVITVALTACKGENAFKRESNPVKAYDSVLREARPFDLSQREQQRQAALDAQKKPEPCAVPFQLSVDGSSDKSASFQENQKKSITLRVQSSLEDGQDWDVRAVESPCDNCLESVSKDDKSEVLKFTWTPTKGSANRPEANILVLRYAWKIEARCAQLPITDAITLNVKMDDGSPSVSFPGLPTTPVVFGGQFKFQVQVLDPKAKLAGAPSLSFEASTAKDAVDAHETPDCEAKGRTIQTADGQTATVFDCAFDSRLLSKVVDLKTLSDSGKTIDAAFSVKLTNKKSKFSTEATSAHIPVLFEKIEAKSPQVEGAKS